jgi:GNAT superfamily N-acetyltransferase
VSCGTIAGMHGWHEWQRGEHTISTDPRRLDVPLIHGFLTDSYWAAGVPLEVVERSLEHSIAFGLYHRSEQVGFARVVTDRATFAYLADVFVLEQHRGQGLGDWLVATVGGHPELQGLRRWMLATADAHPLYARHGFASLREPGRFMERRDASYGS